MSKNSLRPWLNFKELADLYKSIDESNAEFLAMSREQKRVQIAKDVLQQLEINRFEARSVYFDRIGRPAEADEQLSTVLRSTPACFVCGIGALFVASVERLDNIKVSELSTTLDIRSLIVNYLKNRDLFSERELADIEYFFENDWKDTTGRTRMQIIMQHIINTGGAEIVNRGYFV